MHKAKGTEHRAVFVVLPRDSAPSTHTADVITAWEAGAASEAKRVRYIGVTRAEPLCVIATPDALADRVIEILADSTVPFMVEGYSWVRDASLTLRALWVAACPDEIGDFFRFFVTAVGAPADPDGALPILYRVTGERDVHERALDHLTGYHDSRPVRVGNDTWRQTQLDVYGELLDAALLFADRVDQLDQVTSDFLANLANRAAEQWRHPDRRGNRRRNTA